VETGRQHANGIYIERDKLKPFTRENVCICMISMLWAHSYVGVYYSYFLVHSMSRLPSDAVVEVHALLNAIYISYMRIPLHPSPPPFPQSG